MIEQFDKKEIIGMLDCTLLRPDVTDADIEDLCQKAAANEFASITVNPIYVSKCVKMLRGTPVKVGTVVGYPLGEDFLSVKLKQAKLAVSAGARDIDAVISLSNVKRGQWDEVEKEIAALCKVTNKRTLKITIETCYLTKEEIVRLAQLCVKHKVRFISTGTGFGTSGAKVEDIQLIKHTIKEAFRSESIGGKDKDLYAVEVKANGGIFTLEQAIEMAMAGAKRIGSFKAVEIAEEALVELDDKTTQKLKEKIYKFDKVYDKINESHKKELEAQEASNIEAAVDADNTNEEIQEAEAEKNIE